MTRESPVFMIRIVGGRKNTGYTINARNLPPNVRILEKNGESLWYNMACSHQIVVRNGDGR